MTNLSPMWGQFFGKWVRILTRSRAMEGKLVDRDDCGVWLVANDRPFFVSYAVIDRLYLAPEEKTNDR